jgi:glyoxylase-like metal-dependent hydrolase (beta-lactamase superfamily II)
MSVDKLAPGVYRAGSEQVNFYLFEDSGGLTVVDAGLPAFWPDLLAAVETAGRRLSDIRAVLITHGHPDHIGFAERLRVEAGAEIWVGQADAPMLADPRHPTRYGKPERSLLGCALRHPSVLQGPLHLLRNGALRTPAARDVRTLGTDVILDVPGRPTVIPMPGHTRGSTAYLFADHDAVVTGDALVTRDDVTGEAGPRLISPVFTQNSADALSSLDALAAETARLVLTGHGEPWPHGIADAVDQAGQTARSRR